MANMTLSIPEKLKKRLESAPEIKWSNVARQALEKRVDELEWADAALVHSRLTEDDAETIGHKIKAEIAKRFTKRFGQWK